MEIDYRFKKNMLLRFFRIIPKTWDMYVKEGCAFEIHSILHENPRFFNPLSENLEPKFLNNLRAKMFDVRVLILTSSYLIIGSHQAYCN